MINGETSKAWFEIHGYCHFIFYLSSKTMTLYYLSCKTCAQSAGKIPSNHCIKYDLKYGNNFKGKKTSQYIHENFSNGCLELQNFTYFF